MFNAIPEAETQILSSRKGRTLKGFSKFFQIQRLTNQIVIHSDWINDDTIQHKLFLSNHLLSCSFWASFDDKHYSQSKNIYLMLCKKYDASHDEEKSHSLQTNINTDPGTHNTTALNWTGIYTHINSILSTKPRNNF